MRNVSVLLAPCILAFAVWTTPAVVAQEKKSAPFTHGAGAVRQQMLERFDIPGTSYELQLIRVSFGPGFDTKRHSHPGPEASYVLEGEIDFIFDGEVPQRRTAGESIEIPAHAIHKGVAGPAGVVLLNSFVLAKGQPLVMPAP